MKNQVKNLNKKETTRIREKWEGCECIKNSDINRIHIVQCIWKGKDWSEFASDDEYSFTTSYYSKNFHCMVGGRINFTKQEIDALNDGQEVTKPFSSTFKLIKCGKKIQLP